MAKKKEEIVLVDQNVIENSMEDVLHNSMIPYAEYVIMDRALPRVEDGLKPVQRRILYTMLELGITPDKPYRKSARIVGDCLGKYHPHGDTSVYDAMVRMAQDFNMRMTLVSGHGNFGSIDGDSAAAMRYTEARLTPLAMELLRDLDKDTVKFNLNFDDTLKEPDVLPGRFPNLLVNGASGIAVGLATNIPPHNLGEVIEGVCAYISNPKITLGEMMKIIKGPDFPSGGYLIVGEELEKAYATGRGKVTMRSKITIENVDGDKKNIVITELPYQVNKAALLQKILELKENKKEELASVADIVDESDRKGMRAVIKLKKDANVDAILPILLKYSDLECTFGINMVAIANGKPKQMGLLEIIGYYVEYQREVVLKRTKYELNSAKERCHILEGLVIAVTNIDEVIKIIKNAENTTAARQSLRERFSLSEKQAQAILDLRLARISKLETFKLEEELKNLRALIEKLTAIVDSKKLQMNIVKTELNEIKKQYKSERQTVIVQGDEDASISKFDDSIPVEPTVIALSSSHNFKRVTEKNYNMTAKEISSSTGKNDVFVELIKAKTNEALLVFTNLGNCHRLNIWEIPECKLKEKGNPLKNLTAHAQQGEVPICVIKVGEEFPTGNMLFFTKDGLVKKTDFAEYNMMRPVFQAIKLKEGDKLIKMFFDGGDERTTLCFVTKEGICLNAQRDDIPVQGRVSVGVKGIQLNSGDEVVGVELIDDEGEIVIGTTDGNFKRVISAFLEPSARYRKGVKVCELTNGEYISYLSYVKEPYDFAVELDDGSFVSINTEMVTIKARPKAGSQLKAIKDKFMKKAFRNKTKCDE